MSKQSKFHQSGEKKKSKDRRCNKVWRVKNLEVKNLTVTNPIVAATGVQYGVIPTIPGVAGSALLDRFGEAVVIYDVNYISGFAPGQRPEQLQVIFLTLGPFNFVVTRNIPGDSLLMTLPPRTDCLFTLTPTVSVSEAVLPAPGSQVTMTYFGFYLLSIFIPPQGGMDPTLTGSGEISVELRLHDDQISDLSIAPRFFFFYNSR